MKEIKSFSLSIEKKKCEVSNSIVTRMLITSFFFGTIIKSKNRNNTKYKQIEEQYVFITTTRFHFTPFIEAGDL